MKPLSPRQRTVLNLVREQISRYGCAPTVRELASALGVASVNSVQGHLRALERKGWLKRHPHISRGLVLAQRAVPPVLRWGGRVS